MSGQKARIVFTDPPYNLKANEFTNKGIAHHDDFAMGGGKGRKVGNSARYHAAFVMSNPKPLIQIPFFLDYTPYKTICQVYNYPQVIHILDKYCLK